MRLCNWIIRKYSTSWNLIEHNCVGGAFENIQTQEPMGNILHLNVYQVKFLVPTWMSIHQLGWRRGPSYHYFHFTVERFLKQMSWDAQGQHNGCVADWILIWMLNHTFFRWDTMPKGPQVSQVCRNSSYSLPIPWIPETLTNKRQCVKIQPMWHTFHTEPPANVCFILGRPSATKYSWGGVYIEVYVILFVVGVIFNFVSLRASKS